MKETKSMAMNNYIRPICFVAAAMLTCVSLAESAGGGVDMHSHLNFVRQSLSASETKYMLVEIYGELMESVSNRIQRIEKQITMHGASAPTSLVSTISSQAEINNTASIYIGSAARLGTVQRKDATRLLGSVSIGTHLGVDEIVADLVRDATNKIEEFHYTVVDDGHEQAVIYRHHNIHENNRVIWNRSGKFRPVWCVDPVELYTEKLLQALDRADGVRYETSVFPFAAILEYRDGSRIEASYDIKGGFRLLELRSVNATGNVIHKLEFGEFLDFGNVLFPGVIRDSRFTKEGARKVDVVVKIVDIEPFHGRDSTYFDMKKLTHGLKVVSENRKDSAESK